ncbi:hypothetical protein B0H13DRAFT_2339293 [Mycena leptocephala]|nr:hypothetical protein B0H13DRAFT_2339293 [Mycena leptocephala]
MPVEMRTQSRVLFGWIVRCSPPTAHHRAPRRLDVFSRRPTPGLPQGPYTGYPNQIYGIPSPPIRARVPPPPPPATTCTCIHNSSIMRRNTATQADRARRCRAYEVERAASGDMTYLQRWRHWILHREPCTTPTDVHLACLTERTPGEAGHVWSFRSWMGMGIVALAVYTHDERWWEQGSILSTSDVMPPSIHPAATRRVVLRWRHLSLSLVLHRLLYETIGKTCSGGTMAVLSIPKVHSPTHPRRRILLTLSHIELTFD